MSNSPRRNPMALLFALTGLSLVAACTSSAREVPSEVDAPSADAREDVRQDATTFPDRDQADGPHDQDAGDDGQATGQDAADENGTDGSGDAADGGDVVSMCAAGAADCNGEVADGCEANLAADPEHCGACTRSCDGRTCREGFCEPELLVQEPCVGSLPSGIAAFALDGPRLVWLGNRHRMLYGCGGASPFPLVPDLDLVYQLSPGVRWLDKADPSDWGECVRGGSFGRRIQVEGGKSIVESHVFAIIDDSFVPEYLAAAGITSLAWAEGPGTEDPYPCWSSREPKRNFDLGHSDELTDPGGEQGVVGLAARDGMVYWARSGPDGAIVSALRDVGIYEGAHPVEVIADPELVWGLAIDDAYAYWCSGADATAPECGRTLRRVRLGSRADPEDLYSGGCAAIRRDASRVSQWIVVEGDEVFFVSSGVCRARGAASRFGGTLLRLSLASGEVAPIAEDTWAFAVDAGGIYVAGCAPGPHPPCVPELARLSRSGEDRKVLYRGAYGRPEYTLSSPNVPRTPDAVAVDEVHVYWVDDASTLGEPARILRTPK